MAPKTGEPTNVSKIDFQLCDLFLLPVLVITQRARANQTVGGHDAISGREQGQDRIRLCR